MSRLTARELAAVHRLEFPFWLNTVCQALWGACFAAATPADVLSWPALASVVSAVLLVEAGLVLNTVVDLDSDARHPERSTLSSAAARLGARRGYALVLGEAMAGLVLALVVSLHTGHIAVVLAAAGVLLAHVFYNVEPVRLKSRGLVGALVFACGVVMLPSLLTHAALQPDLPPPTALVLAGLTVLAAARVVWWSVPDAAADAAAGMRTTSVRRGPVGALRLACLLLLGGLAVLVWGSWWLGGLVATLVVATGHALFTGSAVLLTHRVSVGAPVSSTWLRRTVMPVVLAADVAVVGVALAV
ncbi:UbiA family prenyltransferase [Saccharomonospora sp. NB11]|uniref:UbiA family prenyltransferase n=1 Tax=Saccharomonospora sp. NB11 TaxID=1642298 RepID=UPI0018D0CEB5|nr:UbiA family prenyltransferase [Saccharomonospora sp. NB11]